MTVRPGPAWPSRLRARSSWLMKRRELAAAECVAERVFGGALVQRLGRDQARGTRVARVLDEGGVRRELRVPRELCVLLLRRSAARDDAVPARGLDRWRIVGD